MTAPRRRTLEARLGSWNGPQARTDQAVIAAELRGEVPVHAAAGSRPDDLTLRELEVVLALVEQGSQRGAADVLGISLQTVKNHATSVLAKVGANHMSHAAWLLWPVLKDAYVVPGRRCVNANRRIGYERRRSGRNAA